MNDSVDSAEPFVEVDRRNQYTQQTAPINSSRLPYTQSNDMVLDSDILFVSDRLTAAGHSSGFHQFRANETSRSIMTDSKVVSTPIKHGNV